MTAMQGALSAAERSMRSVFVGNIPYEATEEQLKDIFSEVGPVVSFRLVYDRETGKPKGYGFCEYKDQEMALSAMRNLNGYELNGRALRVDNAASEKSKEELKNLQASLGGPPVESPFGPEVTPDKAPEVIAKIVASLPPEQLYDLMTQIKMCIENNPHEAKTMLIQNPQLTYALLQAQVALKIVDTETAIGMLHGTTIPVGNPSGLLPTPEAPKVPVSNSQVPPSVNEVSHAFSTAAPSAPIPSNPVVNPPRTTSGPPTRPSLLGDRPPAMPPPPIPNIGNQFPERVDPRMMGDHDLRQPSIIDHDMRPPPMMGGDKDMRHPPMGDQDLRSLNAPPVIPENRSFSDPRYRNMPGPGPDIPPIRGPFDRPGPRPGLPADVRPGFDGRGGVGMSPRLEDPRSANIPPASNMPQGRMPSNPRMASAASGSPLIGSASPSAVSSPRPGNNPLAAAAAAIAPHDQEKAALIMQVLQLTDQQIAMLPPEQRQSIMVLKEQIARSQQAA